MSLEEVEDEDSPRMVSERTQKAEHFVIEDKNEEQFSILGSPTKE